LTNGTTVALAFFAAAGLRGPSRFFLGRFAFFFGGAARDIGAKP
jgi:hypothetical protein